jgi:hypothetical protein
MGRRRFLQSLAAGAAAHKQFRQQNIVLSHAHLPGITQCYPQLVELIKSRGLKTVTLRDVFGG